MATPMSSRLSSPSLTCVQPKAAFPPLRPRPPRGPLPLACAPCTVPAVRASSSMASASITRCDASTITDELMDSLYNEEIGAASIIAEYLD